MHVHLDRTDQTPIGIPSACMRERVIVVTLSFCHSVIHQVFSKMIKARTSQ